MRITQRQVLRGPNYWSTYRKKLIVLTLDLEQYKELPTNRLKSFNESLAKLLPTLHEHRCSIGAVGGFFEQLKEGTSLAHVIEHVALELQTLGGMECTFGRTYCTDNSNLYKILFSYTLEQAGLYAGDAAFNLVHSLALGQEYTKLEENILDLTQIFKKEEFGPSTLSLIREAEKRNIPYTKLPGCSLVTFGQGAYQKKIWATVTSQTSSIGVEVASDKELTKKILDEHFIPVPHGITIQTLEELEHTLQTLHFPLVIKPTNGNHGRGVLTNITTQEKALLGFERAKKISNKVLIEEFIPGDDYRFLVINYKAVAVAQRTPAQIVGDGHSTIQQLIDKVNENPKRGIGHENLLTTIKIDEETNTLLIENNLSLDSVLEMNQILYLKTTANLSSGGTAKDITDFVHPSNLLLAERVARLIHLDVCGIDIVATNIHEPITKYNGAVIEVNAGPGLRMHLQPSSGRSRNVAAPIMEMLYPMGSPTTIPVIAVTGTNGKTTVVRLIAYLAQQANFKVGFCTTEGIYRHGQLIYAGDCSGPLSNNVVLSDPSVNFAVLECARGGILRAGLGFNECDISIINNISADHLGLKEINSLADLARVKSVVAHSTKQSGYCILNADDDLVYAMKNELSCSIALFALKNNERLQNHSRDEGLVCYVENDFIVVQKGAHKKCIAQLSRIPITFKGSASCMIKNILPVVLAGIISDFLQKDIETALYNFLPTPENLPGRMNIFNLGTVQLMIDYAHNEAAYVELKKFLRTIKTTRRMGIICAPGDRRIIDIQQIGYQAAETFDEIIITHDKDTRGNTNENITQALIQGIKRSQYKPIVDVISDEHTALKQSLARANKGAFIFCHPSNIFKTIEFIRNQQAKTVLSLRNIHDA
jgi:cyanophycin synthetase